MLLLEVTPINSLSGDALSEEPVFEQHHESPVLSCVLIPSACHEPDRVGRRLASQHQEDGTAGPVRDVVNEVTLIKSSFEYNY